MMDDDELRALVRQAVRRRLGAPAAARPAIEEGAPAAAPVAPVPAPALPRHPSHGLLPVFTGRASDGTCLIEPVVPCEHCRFCQSYGH